MEYLPLRRHDSPDRMATMLRNGLMKVFPTCHDPVPSKMQRLLEQLDQLGADPLRAADTSDPIQRWQLLSGLAL
jgi:hypothetical protein